MTAQERLEKKVLNNLSMVRDTRVKLWDMLQAIVAGDAGGSYSKPETGIPAADLETAVQDSLALADSAYQKDPETGIQYTDLNEGVQDALDKANAAFSVAMTNQIDSVATTIADLRTDFNSLLTALKAAGFMTADTP